MALPPPHRATVGRRSAQELPRTRPVGCAQAAGVANHQAVNTEPIRFRTRLLQYPDMGPWFQIPAHFIREWGLTATTTVEGTINGHPLGRRAITDSGPKTDDWYMGLTKDIAEAIDGKGGDDVEIELRLADMTLPEEMAGR